jgi:hypothetical protein
LDTIRDGHPDVPIIITAPGTNSTFEDHPGPAVQDDDGTWHAVDRPALLQDGALTGRRCRQLVADVVTSRRRSGDYNLHVIDGRQLDPIGDLSDALHPTIDGYGRMAHHFFDLAFGPGRPFA